MDKTTVFTALMNSLFSYNISKEPINSDMSVGNGIMRKDRCHQQKRRLRCQS